MASTTPVATIETDAFCERCGFNLRSRPVWRDERLGLLVCQCPECGAHQSATGRASALTPWLHRLALLAAIVWVGLGLAFAAAVFFTSFGLQVATVEGLTNSALTTADGTPVNYNFTATGPVVFRTPDRETPLSKEEPLTQRRDLIPLLGGPDHNLRNGYTYSHDVTAFGLSLFAGFAAFGVFVEGAVIAAGTWFWRPRLRWIWLAVPAFASALSLMATRGESLGPYVRSLGYNVTFDVALAAKLVACTAIAQIAMLALGLAVGRKFVRGVLIVFAPPGVRQLFAFLWHCDDKTMPPARKITPPLSS